MKLFLVLVVLISSCATKDDDLGLPPPVKEDEHVDLINNFGLSQDQTNDFKAYETTSLPVEQKHAEAEAEVEKDRSKPKKQDLLKKNIQKNDKKTTRATIDSGIVSKVIAPTPTPTPTPTASSTDANVQSKYSEEFSKFDEKSKNVWKKFNPAFYKGEETTMAVTYLGVTAGHITITSKDIVALNNKIAFHYVARFKSNDSYRYFYWLDDRLDSYVEKNTFLPIKYMLIQREKKQSVDDLQLFDFSKMATYFWYKRIKKDANKDEKGENPIPKYAQDSFSALQFVRGMPLNKGDVYEFPVITRGKIWKLKIEVMGEEKIEIGDGEITAIKIKAETHFPGVLKKMGDTFFWYGITPERRLLKFQAKIKIGSIYGETVSHKSGEKL